MNQTERIEKFFSMFRGGTETLKQYIVYQKKFTDGEEAIIEKKRNEIIERRIEEYRKDYEENKNNPERERQLQEISDKIEELSKESETAFLKPEVQLLYQKLLMLQGEGEHLIESEDFFEEDPEKLNPLSFMIIQNNTTLVLIYSFFENQLMGLCNILGKKAPIHYYDLKGDATVQCEKFLIKFCKVKNFIFEQIHWQFLDTIRVLRNQIIHNNPDYFSVLTKKVLNSTDKEYIRRNLEEIIQTENFLRTENDNDYCIRLSDTFLLKVINYIEIFFSDLENYVQKKR